MYHAKYTDYNYKHSTKKTVNYNNNNNNNNHNFYSIDSINVALRKY